MHPFFLCYLALQVDFYVYMLELPTMSFALVLRLLICIFVVHIH